MMDDCEKCILGFAGIVIGLPIIASLITDILDYKQKSLKYKKRDERINTFQKNGANVHINLNGEI